MKGIMIDAGNWRGGETKRIGVFSDPHIEICGDNKKLKKELDRAVSLGCRLCFNGDLSDFIYPGDKRYTPERDEGEDRNDKIDQAVDFIIDFLEPYKEYIDFIGYGNHDTTILNRYYTDPVRRVCASLGVERAAYRELVRYVWRHESGGTRTLTGYFHHGKSGVATKNKGVIALGDMMKAAEADFYVVGHGHRAAVDGGDVQNYMDRRGNVKRRIRKGFQVPGFHVEHSPSGTGYGETFYQETPTGWGLIEATMNNDGIEFDLITKVVA